MPQLPADQHAREEKLTQRRIRYPPNPLSGALLSY